MPWHKRGPRPRSLPPAAPYSLEAMRRRYVEWLRVKSYSEHTLAQTGRYLTYFVRWCEERAIVRPGDVTAPILRQYQRWLYHYRTKKARPLGVSSQHSRLVSLRMFFRWLTREKHILFNPASELELPRGISGRLPRNVLTHEEVERLVSQPDLTAPLGLRDRALLEVLYSTGIRRQELLNLRIADVDLERGTVLIREGKGRKDRVVPIGERALLWLDKYLLEERPRLASMTPRSLEDQGTLFLTQGGEPFNASHLGWTVRQYVTSAGIAEKRGGCHLVRHTVATLMLDNGADVRWIQELLGHKSLQTTQLYTHVSIRRLKEVHAATHPGARLGPSQKPAAPAAGEEDPEGGA